MCTQKKCLSIILISGSFGCRDQFESSDVLSEEAEDFTPFWVAICLQVKCITVPVRANYERGDLQRHGDVRQDLVCLCWTEKVDPTLVSGIFISGFSAAFGHRFLFLLREFGITSARGAVVLWVMAKAMQWHTHRLPSLSLPSMDQNCICPQWTGHRGPQNVWVGGDLRVF